MLHLDLFCMSISKMCPKILLCFTPFLHRNALLCNSGGNLTEYLLCTRDQTENFPPILFNPPHRYTVSYIFTNETES